MVTDHRRTRHTMNYEIKDGEHGDEIYKDGERIAFKNEEGKWNAAYGKSAEKAAAVEWYDGQRLEDNDEPVVTTEDGLKTEETPDSKTFSAEEGHELVVDSEDRDN